MNMATDNFIYPILYSRRLPVYSIPPLVGSFHGVATKDMTHPEPCLFDLPRGLPIDNLLSAPRYSQPPPPKQAYTVLHHLDLFKL
jgi:hypothetical protein